MKRCWPRWLSWSPIVWLLGCWPSVPERAEPGAFVALEPSDLVDLVEPVGLRFSVPVRPSEAISEWVQVLRLDGRPVPLVWVDSAARARIELGPRESWPPGELLTVHIGAELVDELGRPVMPPPVAPTFQTVSASPEISVELRMPRPTERWPSNLRYLALAISPPDLDVDTLWLRSAQTRWWIDLVRRDQGRVLVRLPEHQGPCQPLCPDAAHVLELETPTGLFVGPEVLTATSADHQAPLVQPRTPVRRGATFYVDIDSSEPVVFHAEARALDGHEVRLRSPMIPARSSRLETETTLAPETAYSISIRAEDLAGNRAEELVYSVVTPPAPEIEITELVLAPLHDWGDSEPAGAPFDAQPGTGPVTDIDQWVELVNRSASVIAIDGSGLVLSALDQTPTETWLEGAPRLFFGSGGDLSQWWPGEALVVRLRGRMSRSELVLELHHGVALLDRVEIGRGEEADHVGGRPPNLAHEAIAKDHLGRFRFCEATPGDATPPAHCSPW